MKKTFDWLTENIRSDIEKARNNKIDELYDSLKKLLKKYDADPTIKNINDWFKQILKSKREKCKLVLEDVIEEMNKPNFSRKEELRKDLLEISNIHRDFLENLISLLESL